MERKLREGLLESPSLNDVQETSEARHDGASPALNDDSELLPAGERLAIFLAQQDEEAARAQANV
jgi:hypothetical protein